MTRWLSVMRGFLFNYSTRSYFKTLRKAGQGFSPDNQEPVK
jgi:hypothetical protein